MMHHFRGGGGWRFFRRCGGRGNAVLVVVVWHILVVLMVDVGLLVGVEEVGRFDRVPRRRQGGTKHRVDPVQVLLAVLGAQAVAAAPRAVKSGLAAHTAAGNL